MAQITGIKPTRTIGQDVERLMAIPIHVRPVERPQYDRPANTGRRSSAFTGIPGISKKAKVFVVTAHERNRRVHIGSFINMRTAVQMLANHKGCRPTDLPGISQMTWDIMRAREKFEPYKTARDVKS